MIAVTSLVHGSPITTETINGNGPQTLSTEAQRGEDASERIIHIEVPEATPMTFTTNPITNISNLVTSIAIAKSKD